MTIESAKVVGELAAGFITVVLNPDATGTDMVNNTRSELVATLPKDIIPADLREPGSDIWFATEQLSDSENTLIKKVFPMTSDEIPEAYYEWLRENDISPAS